jgi:hypothetical protein
MIEQRIRDSKVEGSNQAVPWHKEKIDSLSARSSYFGAKTLSIKTFQLTTLLGLIYDSHGT